MIKGLYVVEGYTLPDFHDLENNGLTHVFYAESYILRNFTTCKSNIESVITALEGTDLKLFIDIIPFRDASLEYVDPASETHLNNLLPNIVELVETYEEIEGILFDDFYYPPAFYNEGELETQKQVLYDFADAIKTGILAVNEDLQLSANISPSTVQAADPTLLSGVFDFIIVLTGTYRADYITTALDNVSVPLIPELESANTWLTDIKTSTTLEGYFKNTLNHRVGGYCVYASPSIPEDLTFPSCFREGVASRNEATRSVASRTAVVRE